MVIASLFPESLGDFLLTTPSLKALQENFPEDEVVWVFHDSLLEIANLVPLKAKRVSFSSLKTYLQGRRERPDITFCFPPATRYYWLARKIGGIKRVGYVHEKMYIPRIASKLCLTHRWICPANLEIHELEAYGKILSLLDIKFQACSPLLEISEKAQQKALEWLKQKGVEDSKNIIAIHLNSKWPENPLLFLRNFKESRFLVLFGKSEEEIARRSVQEAEISGLLIPGPQDLAAYAAFLKSSSLFIAYDGGPVHLASATKTSVVVFYPEDNFEYRVSKWHPWGVPYKAFPSLKENLGKLPEIITGFQRK